MMGSVHDQIHSLIAAYAMGAVPAEEIPAIRAHVLTCEECFEEAESYAGSLAALAESVEPVALSQGFADRVVREALGELQPASSRRRWPSLRSLSLGFAAVSAAAAVIIGGIAYRGSVERQREYQNVVMTLIRDPGALTLQGPGGAEGVIASTDQGTLLVALDLGEAPRGSDYQLWLMKDGVPVPDETFDVSGGIAIVESERSIDDYDGAAITVEPDGGSKQPTTDPVLST